MRIHHGAVAFIAFVAAHADQYEPHLQSLFQEDQIVPEVVPHTANINSFDFVSPDGVTASLGEGQIEYKTWKGTIWPEAETEAVRTRGSVGIALSGGGSRAYSASVGLVRGLGAQGHMERSAYLSTISGGSWFSATYTYHKTGASDDELLGAPVKADELTTQSLQDANNYLMAEIPQRLSKSVLASYLLKPMLDDKYTFNSLWIDAIYDAYLKPFEIGSQYFTWSKADADGIRKRNPSMKSTPILSALPGRPYLIMSGTLMGPLKVAPFPVPKQNYYLFEMGGLATGVSIPSVQVTYSGAGGGSESVQLGGFQENFAVGSMPVTQPSKTDTQKMRANPTDYHMSLAWAVGVSKRSDTTI